MKKVVFFVALIAYILVLCSCKETSESNDNGIKNPNYSQPTNPYEFVGVRHNEIVNYLLDTLGVLNLPNDWPCDSIIDTTLYYSDNYYQENYPNDPYEPVLNNQIAENWISTINNLDTLLINLDNAIQNSSLSLKDKDYGSQVFDLLLLGLDSLYKNPDEFLDSIYQLETKIISEEWDENEVFALMSISLLKNSYELNCSNNIFNTVYKKNSSSKLQVSESEGWKRIAATTIDYTTGAGYFLAATGGSCGAGTGLALGTASTVAAGSTYLAKALGGALGLWDLDFDDINPFS